jgi:hypothetical protein
MTCRAASGEVERFWSVTAIALDQLLSLAQRLRFQALPLAQRPRRRLDVEMICPFAPPLDGSRGKAPTGTVVWA